MAEDIAGNLHPGVAHVTLPAGLLDVARFDPHVHMDHVAAASRARHDEASAVDALGLAHQAALRPDLLTVPDGMAISRGSPFASHVGLTLVGHRDLGTVIA